jgi:hypothetical protein
MTAPPVILRGIAVLVFVLGGAACGTAQPSPSPAAVVPEAGPIVGCSKVDQPECLALVDRVLACVGPAHGQPSAVEIGLFSCANGAACPRSLTARQGAVTVDFEGGALPIQLSLAGPPDTPQIAVEPIQWSGLLQPASSRVFGPGPFQFELGHCGISHVVDFDGSFWVPIGQVDGESPEAINAGSGQMQLLAADRAEYRGPHLIVTLARFPGPKFFWLCS